MTSSSPTRRLHFDSLAIDPRVVTHAVAAIAARCGKPRPSVGLILGSGLGGVTQHIKDATRIPFGEIPGMPPASVPGHPGALVHGTVGEHEVVAFAGRPHLYEGHESALVGLPVRIVHALGARILFVANAAGAIRDAFEPGTLMVLCDHINMASRNPLVGPVVHTDSRFPDLSAPYDVLLGASFRAAAATAGLKVVEGVYASVVGPSYETPAEVRMLRLAGADAVGMSTVPEVLVAKALGLRVVAVSCLTNRAAGTASYQLAHAEVLATANRVAPALERAIIEWLGHVPRVTADRA